ncbi:MAG TPA: SET domain-containing protein [Pyrinomonadaceae bacterium]|nr:SET domain-containing protein [Pyrinomonadaceae bacterium]
MLKRTLTGLGLYTVQRIPKGRRIIEYIGPIIDREERDKKGGKYLFEIDEEWAIDGSARSNIARYINHACRPNAEAFVTGKRIWIWSRKAIEAGEEITINYGKEYVEEHIEPKGCKCKKCFAG